MLELYQPAFDDLWFRQNLLSDDETMAYNHAYGGTIDFGKAKWEQWYDFWITNNQSKRFYRYLKRGPIFVGEVSYHHDEDSGVYIADILVFFPYRKKGFGSEGLTLLCDAAKENGIKALYDNIAIDNPSINLFLKNGFTEEYRNNEIIMVKKELL